MAAIPSAFCESHHSTSIPSFLKASAVSELCGKSITSVDDLSNDHIITIFLLARLLKAQIKKQKLLRKLQLYTKTHRTPHPTNPRAPMPQLPLTSRPSSPKPSSGLCDLSHQDWLKGYVVGLLFAEPSTRTKCSFEAAAKRLGASVVAVDDPVTYINRNTEKGVGGIGENAEESCINGLGGGVREDLSSYDCKSWHSSNGGIQTIPFQGRSSLAKGESLDDTARMLAAYCDCLVMRLPQEGMVARVAEMLSDIPVANGGDGVSEHPTQGLLDLFTVAEFFPSIIEQLGGQAGCQSWEEVADIGYGRVSGSKLIDRSLVGSESEHKSDGWLRIALVGDLLNGRTVHSLVKLLRRFERIELIFVAPPALQFPYHLLARNTLKLDSTPTPLDETDLNPGTQVTSGSSIASTDTWSKTSALQTKLVEDGGVCLYEDSCSRGISYCFLQEEVLRKVDIIYLTRLQKERLKGGCLEGRISDCIQRSDSEGSAFPSCEPDTTASSVSNGIVRHSLSLDDVYSSYRLTSSRLDAHCKGSCRVLHPLPRLNEIDISVDANRRQAYFEQSRNGLFIRMAVLVLMLGVVPTVLIDLPHGEADGDGV